MPAGSTGSATGGKAGMTSTLGKGADARASKVERPKDDVDQGAMDTNLHRHEEHGGWQERCSGPAGQEWYEGCTCDEHWDMFAGALRERGYPLGRGRPEDVPQEFSDQFHSAREEQFASS